MEYVLEKKFDFDPMIYFQDISKIPRGSGKEKQISNYLFSFFKRLDCFVYQDKALNIYAKKAGVGTGKDKEAILLQGHMDIVWEKNASTNFDFETDPIKLVVDGGDILKADGTTLGADNGVAIAYIMSLFADTTAKNFPPIECLITTEEETGLFGATAADMSIFDSKKLINLDCGPEGGFVAGCAGGCRTSYEKRVSTETFSPSYQKLSIDVAGLQGGHSGGCIDKERGNSIKILSRILFELGKVNNILLADINGGDKDNAIPREATANLYTENILEAKKYLEEIISNIKNETRDTEKDLKITAYESDFNILPLTQHHSQDIINFLYMVRSGFEHKSTVLDDLVINSNNLASVKMADNSITVTTSTRSSIESLKTDLLNKNEILANTYEFSFTHNANYPGWEYNKNSPLRSDMIKVYEKFTGEEASVHATHGGLECGILIGKKPGMDAVAIGPDGGNGHTPEEFLNIPSFYRVFDFLKEYLSSLA